LGAEVGLGVAATAFAGADATSLVFTGAALAAGVTVEGDLLDLEAGAAVLVFDAVEELGFAGDLATALTGAAGLATPFLTGTALDFALAAVTLVDVF